MASNEVNEPELKKLQTGTTTVGVVCSDGVILASDKRATMGYFIANKDIQKVYQIDDHLGMLDAHGALHLHESHVGMRYEEHFFRGSVATADFIQHLVRRPPDFTVCVNDRAISESKFLTGAGPGDAIPRSALRYDHKIW